MTGPAAKLPQHGLDTPLPLRPAQNYFQLAGWAFVPGAAQPSQVRVVVNDRAYAPAELTGRVDVAASYPDEPHAARSGFKFVVYLPFGLHLGTLEVSADGRNWHRLRALVIPVSSHPILGAVEKPPAGQPITKPMRIEGWCFHPEFTVKEIVLQFGNVEVPCLHGQERPDVAARFPEHPAARHSGFITDENLPRGSGRVKIRALTECGRVYFVSSDHEIAIEKGFIPKPPPPSPARDRSMMAVAAAAEPVGPEIPAGSVPAGERNILFALYGDFFANSALHVTALANELIALGYDCVVAVPSHKETLGALPRAGFVALNFAELPRLPACFKDGRGPCLVHAWTTRENVRQFASAVAARHGSAILVHLEDNEQEILETRLGRPFAELAALPDAELDPLIPPTLSHPRRAAGFLRAAAGVTVIVDRLREQVPAGRPCRVIWPAADSANFFPRPRDDAMRRQLGYRPDDILLFYHGNTHTSNAAEMRSLYEAVALLNRRHRPTQLIRTGRDFPGFLPEGDAWIRPHLVHLGHIGRARLLPTLMATADYFVQPGAPGTFNDYRFPSKLPEFFALGRPVILPHANLGQLVRHGEQAWVLPDADARGIADAIETLHDDPALRQRLSEGAVAFARDNFSWPRSAGQLLEFYRSVTPLAPPDRTAGSKDRRILLTGGRGCLAGVLARHFTTGGAAVKTFSRTGDANHRALDQLLAPGMLEQADTLLHLAWSTVPFNAEQQPDGGREQDLELLAKILGRIAAGPARERLHFIFFSSGGTVYGNARAGQPSRESDPCHPIGRHGQAKLAAEKLVEELGRRHGLTWTILRISNPYGFAVPASRPQGIIPVALKCARAGTPLTLWGDGTARKDFLHHTDFSAALEKIIRLRPTGIFNLSSGRSHTLRELLALIEQATGRRIPTQHVPAHPWDVHDSLLDNTKLRTAIGWQPAVSLADGIRRAAEELGIP